MHAAYGQLPNSIYRNPNTLKHAGKYTYRQL